MPSLQDSLASKINMSGYSPVDIPSRPNIPYSDAMTQQSITRDVYLRSPVPPIGIASPDSLRQFYLNSSLPQRRAFVS